MAQLSLMVTCEHSVANSISHSPVAGAHHCSSPSGPDPAASFCCRRHIRPATGSCWTSSQPLSAQCVLCSLHASAVVCMRPVPSPRNMAGADTAGPLVHKGLSAHVSAHGQLAAKLMLSHVPQVDLKRYTTETYMRIVTYKTAYYSFYLPVACGLLIGGVSDDASLELAKDICVRMGQYFQVLLLPVRRAVRTRLHGLVHNTAASNF